MSLFMGIRMLISNPAICSKTRGSIGVFRGVVKPIPAQACARVGVRRSSFSYAVMIVYVRILLKCV